MHFCRGVAPRRGPCYHHNGGAELLQGNVGHLFDRKSGRTSDYCTGRSSLIAVAELGRCAGNQPFVSTITDVKVCLVGDERAWHGRSSRAKTALHERSDPWVRVCSGRYACVRLRSPVRGRSAAHSAPVDAGVDGADEAHAGPLAREYAASRDGSSCDSTCDDRDAWIDSADRCRHYTVYDHDSVPAPDLASHCIADDPRPEFSRRFFQLHLLLRTSRLRRHRQRRRPLLRSQNQRPLL